MKLTIIGASGHGRVIADIARLNGYDEIEFLDDNKSLKKCGPYPVVGTTDSVYNVNTDLFIGIGNSAIRKRYMEQFSKNRFVTLIHPKAVVAEDVAIGRGSVIMAGSVVNPGTVLGDGVIINTCSSVDHDCIIESYVHIAVGAHVCGSVKIGESTWIGAGATISNCISICDNCTIGIGAAVIQNIFEQGTYVGVPVHKISRN